MKRKELTTDEMFCGMKQLRTYFKMKEDMIRRYGKKEKIEEDIKKWREKREKLLETAKNMRVTDLEIIYYIHNIENIKSCNIIFLLRKLSDAWNELESQRK